MPSTIEVQFTEEDRQSAGPYACGRECLLATALKRMGYDPLVGYMGHVRFKDGSEFAPTRPFAASIVENHEAVERPFYKPEVVGRKLSLVCVREPVAVPA